MIKLGVSACLLGQKVRYDGKHKFVNLTKYFDPEHYQLIPICPEVEMGLTIPRPAIEMYVIGQQARLVQVGNWQLDFTEQLNSWFNNNKQRLKKYQGFILKSKSPSCGNQTTPHFQTNNQSNLADGLFVQLLKQRNIHLPIIDEISIKNKTFLTNFMLKLKPEKK